MTPDLDDLEDFKRHVASRTPEVSKDDWIVSLAPRCKVLDIGCIDHSVETALGLGSGWLHSRLREVADRLVGLDLLEDDAAALTRDHGYDIRFGDAESFDLGETFDLIVAGDLIEHLSNPGMFLERVAAHMSDDGRAVITTPNPFNIEQVVHVLFRNDLFVNPEHALWLDPRTIHQLVSRSPLRISEFRWIQTRFSFHLRGGRVARRVANPLSRASMRFRPLLRRDFGVVLTHRR